MHAQAKAPSFYSLSDDVWLDAMNMTSNELQVKKLTDALGATSQHNDMDEFQEVLWAQKQMIWHHKGMMLGFSKMKPEVLTTIKFFNESSIYGAAAKLPFNLSFSDSSKEIKAKFGDLLTEEADGDFVVQVYPTKYPHVYLDIDMDDDEDKVGFAISLYFDEYTSYMLNPSPHNLEDDAYMCDAFAAMIEDADNKFFNFRGKRSNSAFPKWESNVILDELEVVQTMVFHDYIKLTAYTGTNFMRASAQLESHYYYFAGCVEDEEIPYSWTTVDEQSEDHYKAIVTTKDKNVQVEHYFETEKPLYDGDTTERFSAYTIIRYVDVSEK